MTEIRYTHYSSQLPVFPVLLSAIMVTGIENSAASMDLEHLMDSLLTGLTHRYHVKPIIRLPTSHA